MNNRIKNETDLSMIINDASFSDYYARLKMLACSIFYWKNLDKLYGIGANDFLENSLFRFGKAVAVEDNENGKLILHVNPSNFVNVYDLPTTLECFSNGYNKTFDFDKTIYIKNNIDEIPTMNSIQLVAYRLYDTERAIDINRNALKTPLLIEGDKQSMLTLKNLYMQYSGNTPVIYGKKNFNLSNKLNVLKTDVPYLIDKLTIHKHELWNDLLSFLGINNANTDKKERLITDEVNSNDELINTYLSLFYTPRKIACDRINEKYNLEGDDKIEIIINREKINELLNINKDISNKNNENNEDGDFNE